MFAVAIADAAARSASVLGDHGIQKSGDDLLFGPGQMGDGIELLFEPGGRATLAGQADGGLTGQYLVERQVEQLDHARKHGGTDADTSDLVVGQRLLGDAEGIGKLHLRQAAFLEL